jgi:pyruvate dehydrogenase E2 component (dihydrolipoamide acetyltransferase)
MASLLTAKNVGSAFLNGSTQKLTQKRTNQKQSRKTNTSSVVVRAEVKEIFMPALSSTMTEGKIVSWVKEEGDAISKGEAVVVVESDKADMDVESFYDGFLAHICVEDGEMATVGAPIAYVAETEAEIPEAQAKAAAAAGGAAPAPAAAPAEAAPAPAPAPAAAAPAAAAPAPAAAAPAPAPVVNTGRIVATPYAKKLAKKSKIKLETIKGTGLNGRITGEDVEKAAGIAPAAKPAAAAAAAPAAAAPSAKPAPAPLPAPAGTATPLPPMQKAVAKNMLPSLSVPVSRVAMPICTDKLDQLYQKLKPKGVTMTALLSKAMGNALAKHPIMFASYHDESQSIVYNDEVNIACAVALDGGLITPVLRNVANTDVYEVGRQWKELVGKAKSGKLGPADYAGGNFTISNMGMFGVSAFDAILPPGQGAIIAIGAGIKTVVPIDGMIGVKTMMTVNVTADHRHINGDVAAGFLKTLKEVIENPDDLTF